MDHDGRQVTKGFRGGAGQGAIEGGGVDDAHRMGLVLERGGQAGGGDEHRGEFVPCLGCRWSFGKVQEAFGEGGRSLCRAGGGGGENEGGGAVGAGGSSGAGRGGHGKVGGNVGGGEAERPEGWGSGARRVQSGMCGVGRAWEKSAVNGRKGSATEAWGSGLCAA